MRKVLTFLVLLVVVSGFALAEKAPLNVAIIWHQHQPLYLNTITGEYELPWVRVHGVQEYVDSPRILAEFPGIHVTYNLQPSLLWQIMDYVQITLQEETKGGLYQYIGAVDDHLQWIWKLITDPSLLSADERSKMQTQFFWINGYMFDNDGDDPYFDPRYAELNTLKGELAFTDQELMDAAGLSLLWEISPELHEDLRISELRGKIGFTVDDIMALIVAQHTVLAKVVDAYKQAQGMGSELITSPFYHPILPLLCDRGWESDALGQIEAGQAQHTALFGAPAVGVWPPEEAVSDKAVQLLAQAGFSWTVTDNGILAQSLGHTPNISELTSAWRYGDIHVLFRNSDLSNRLAFSYGNKVTGLAVSDFMNKLHEIWDQMQSPEDHLLTIALDGENWMFMAGYPNNGRSFLRALYEAITDDKDILTVTPKEFLIAHDGVRRTLPNIATGSWGGDLSTWIGEPEENEGWTRLEAARAAVSDAGDPEDAVSAIYAAEGSDWFWWYGSDQNSGTDDLFDWLFKKNLITAYCAAGTPENKIPQVLSLRLGSPITASLGEVKPTLDGVVTSPDEWTEATSFTGSGAIDCFSVGYREETLYVMVKTSEPASDLIGKNIHLAMYTSGQPGNPQNVATHYSGAQLGFSLGSAAEINFAKIKADGSGVVSRYAPDGDGNWHYASSIATLLSRKAEVADVIEFEIPFKELGIEPGKAVTLVVALEEDGTTSGRAPASPVLAQIPTLVQGSAVFSVTDPKGDDNGPGTYTYPTNNVFAEQGLFDLTCYTIYDSGETWQFAFDIATLPNPWNGPQGFSHPIIFLYLDVKDGGGTISSDEAAAAQVRFDPNHPWDVFVRIAGWPAYGRHLWTADGTGPELVVVASDPKKGRIIVTIPKSILPQVDGWHYVMVGSQDGYGKDYLRAMGEVAGEWAGGGCPDPMYAPQIYDYLAPTDASQGEILSGYDAQQGTFAKLLPVHVQVKQ
jgi:alpha-amylase/alpha-mannosidase (GH57 family)